MKRGTGAPWGLQWQRVLGESLAIIASILFALWLDGVVEERREAGLERDYLESLAEDLREDSVALELALANAEERREAGRVVVTVVEGDSTPDDYFVMDLARLGNIREFRPASLTVDELRETGRVRLIRDRDLLRNAIRYYLESERPPLTRALRERNFLSYVETIDATLGTGIGSDLVRQMLEDDEMRFSWIGPGPLPVDALRQNRRFVNAVDALWMAANADEERLTSLTDANHQLLGRLSEILGSSGD